MDALVRAAGVTKPTLYAQFGSKTRLVAAVLERRHDLRRGSLEDWLAPVPVAERPLAVLDWPADFYDGHPGRLGSLLLLLDGVAGRVVVGGPAVASAAVADARAAAATLLAVA